jgi:hypothetical protein
VDQLKQELSPWRTNPRQPLYLNIHLQHPDTHMIHLVEHWSFSYQTDQHLPYYLFNFFFVAVLGF